MKQLLFLTCVLLSVLSMYAQGATDDYRPFIEEGKVWVSKPEIVLAMAGIITPRVVVEYDYFQGDTLIGAQSCKRWVQDYRDIEGNQLLSVVVPIYEENKKVWFFLDGYDSPFLAYDFGVQEGDTLAIVSPNAYHYMIQKKYNMQDEFFQSFSDTLVIKKKTEEELHGRKRTLIYFCSTFRHNGNITSDDFLEYNYYMYGIGTHWNPSYNMTWVGSGNGSHWLMYCMVGDEVLYADEEKADFWGIAKPTDILSSIPSPSLDTKPSTRHRYDLTGRHLAVPPSKGVYIEDGRKKVANKGR